MGELVIEVSGIFGKRCPACDEGRRNGLSAYRYTPTGEIVILCYRCAAQIDAYLHGWKGPTR